MSAQRASRPSPGLSGDAPGVILAGRYELGERLGSGGAANVVRAVDLPLGRPVAVKIFRPDSDPALEAGFTEEAALLARLQHPGLVTVYDAGVHEGRPYLVMHLVEGPTLRQRIQEGTLTPGAARRLGERLAHALAHVHDTGIVHRDVKPSNILLDDDGRPHLADFGIARRADAATRTRSGVLTGTAAYLSPEQVRGDRPGPPSDVYALGLVLLECLTGELEYDGTPLEAAVARLHRAPAIPEDIPVDLGELLAAMTHAVPEQRPDALTCAEWLATGLTTAGDTPPQPPAPRGPRGGLTARAPLAVLGTLLCVFAGGLTLAVSQSGPSRPAGQEPHTTVEPRTSPSADDVAPADERPSTHEEEPADEDDAEQAEPVTAPGPSDPTRPEPRKVPRDPSPVLPSSRPTPTAPGSSPTPQPSSPTPSQPSPTPDPSGPASPSPTGQTTSGEPAPDTSHP